MPLVSTEHVSVLLFQTPLYVPFNEEEEPARVNVTLSETVAASISAVAIAPDPPPPEKKTLGANTYPEPGLVMTTPVTCPESVSESTAVPTPPVPPPSSVMVTLGTMLYPLPGFVITKPLISPPSTVAVAVAWTPPLIEGAPIVTTITLVYPAPALDTVIEETRPGPPISVTLCTRAAARWFAETHHRHGGIAGAAIGDGHRTDPARCLPRSDGETDGTFVAVFLISGQGIVSGGIGGCLNRRPG